MRILVPPHHHNQAEPLPSRQMYGCMYGWTGGSACMPVCMYVCMYICMAGHCAQIPPRDPGPAPGRSQPAARRSPSGGVTTPLCKPGRRELGSQIPFFSIGIMSQSTLHDSLWRNLLFFSQYPGPRRIPISPGGHARGWAWARMEGPKISPAIELHRTHYVIQRQDWPRMRSSPSPGRSTGAIGRVWSKATAWPQRRAHSAIHARRYAVGHAGPYRTIPVKGRGFAPLEVAGQGRRAFHMVDAASCGGPIQDRSTAVGSARSVQTAIHTAVWQGPARSVPDIQTDRHATIQMYGKGRVAI